MEHFDVVVLGTGAAGLCAALAAADSGARVGLFEKGRLVGGTTALASAVAWIPPLLVVGEPTPLPEASFFLASWFDFFKGVDDGAWLTCQLSETAPCRSSNTTSVPPTIYRLVAAEVRWQLPPVHGGVMWTARVDLAADTIEEVSPITRDYFGEAVTEPESLGRFAFPLADSACVTVVLTDLRTNQETRARSCATPAPAAYADSDTELAKCSASPSQRLTEAWCRLKQGSSNFPECRGLSNGTGGAGGGAGVAGWQNGVAGRNVSDYYPGGASNGWAAGSESGSGSGAANQRPNNGESEGANTPRTSQSCQLGSPGSPLSGAVWSTLALAWLAKRRRAGRRAHRAATIALTRAGAGKPAGAATDTLLALCSAPPSQTLSEAWCELLALPPTSAACQPSTGGSGGS